MKKDTIYDKLAQSKGQIFACFTRSFDESHIKNNKIHLISSVIYNNNLDLSKYIKNINKMFENNEQYYLVIVVDPGLNLNNSEKDETNIK